MSDPFVNLPRGHYGAILADPPWRFEVWSGETAVKCRSSTPEKHGSYLASGVHYQTLDQMEISALPVGDLAAKDACLFLWITWPLLPAAMTLIGGWGFTYKTCGFSWMKAHARQVDLLRDDIDASMGMGYWTRANSEVCLLATRGSPKRLNADVRQGIIEPRREHSRKPDCVPGRIERLVAGPYLELFARTRRPGWDCWGNQTDKFVSGRVLDGAP